MIVVNAEKIKVTGKKMDQKIYYHHSDYVGGMKETTLKEMLAKHPDRVIELAVKGMLPKGPLGRQMYTEIIRIRWTGSQACSSEARSFNILIGKEVNYSG